MDELKFIFKEIVEKIDDNTNKNSGKVNILKSKSIEILENITIKKDSNQNINREWLDMLKEANEKNQKLGIEAYILLYTYIRIFEDGINLKIEKFILKTLYEEVHFNLKPLVLIKYLKIGINTNEDEYLRGILIKKFQMIQEIKLELNEDSEILFEFENISKREYFSYYSEYRNFYFMINEKLIIINIENGNILKKLDLEKEEVFKSYAQLKSILNKNKAFDIEIQYNRLLLYRAAKYLKTNKVMRITEENMVLDIIWGYQNLFRPSYIEELKEKFKKKNANEYIDEYEENPSEDTLKKIFNKSKDIDDILQVIKYVEKISAKELNIDVYISAIINCNRISENHIKTALFCEELIVKKPIIIDEIVKFLKGMYLEEIYTKNTLKTLEYISCTTRNDNELEEIKIKVKASEKKFDREFIEEFIGVYNSSNEKEKFDRILNEIINAEIFRMNSKLIGAMYDFYKRNNDMRALVRICFFQYSIKDNEIFEYLNIEDFDKILKRYEKTVLSNEEIGYLLYIINIYIEKEECHNMVERFFNVVQKKNTIIPVIYKYPKIIDKMKNESEEFKNIFINGILNGKIEINQKNIEEIIEIYMDTNTEVEIRVSLLKVIIRNLKKYSRENKIAEILKMYFETINEKEDSKTIQEILLIIKDNISIIEKLFKKFDLKGIKGIQHIITILGIKLLDAKKFEIMPEVLVYFIRNEKYKESQYILERYLLEANYIDEFDYVNVLVIMDKLEDRRVKSDIYKKLILREDCPIDIREKYYELWPKEENRKKLKKAFKDKKTKNILSKNLFLEDANDEEFLEYCNVGEVDNKTDILIKEKVEKLFKNNKEYIVRLLKFSKNEDFKEIYEYAKSFEDAFDLEDSNVYGNFKVIERKEGEICDVILGKDIFNNKEEKLLLLTKEENLKFRKEFINYLKISNIKYQRVSEETGDNVIKIIDKELEMKKLPFLNLMRSLKNLLQFEANLLKNGISIIDFKKDSFIIYKEGIIPRNLEMIIQFNERCTIKNKILFDEKAFESRILENKKNIIIDEAKLVNIIKIYIENMILNYISEDESKIKLKILKTLECCKINNVEDLQKLLMKLENELSFEFTEISYKEMIGNFEEAEINDKIQTLKLVIDRRDTREITKNIFIRSLRLESVAKNIEKIKLIEYALECFNESVEKLNQENICELYDFVNDNIDNCTIEEYSSIENSVADMYIYAKEKCKYSKIDIKNDIKEKNILSNKSYLLDRI